MPKEEKQIMGYKLGRLPSPFDARDYALTDFMPGAVRRLFSITTSRIWTWQGSPLDQGQTPHCVGFATAGWGISEPIYDAFKNADGHRFYADCKRVDGIPNAQGSTVRAAAKVLQQYGLLKTYAFAQSVDEIKYWLLNQSPIIFGTVWTTGMFTPDKDGIAHPTGSEAGGHAYLAYGWQDDMAVCKNSWGAWGAKKDGTFYILKQDLQLLMHRGGEALAAVEISHTPLPPSPPAPEPAKPRKPRHRK